MRKLLASTLTVCLFAILALALRPVPLARVSASQNVPTPTISVMDLTLAQDRALPVIAADGI